MYIGKAAELCKVSVKTIRYYESLGLLPVSIAASFGAFLIARHFGVELEPVVLVGTAASLVLALLAERLLPHVPSWNRIDDQIGTDLTSAAVLIGVVEPLLKLLAPLAAVALYSLYDASGLYAATLGQTHFLLQLLVVTLLIEFGRYWSHRLHHRLSPLWWLHALHHGSERLHTLNNLRFHPLNHILNFAAGVFPLIVVGVPAELLLGYLALTQPVLMLQHANLDSRYGLLNYLFITNEIHRWHHSAEASEADCNYGNALVIWDQVFGTFRYRAGETGPATIGLFAGSSRRYPARSPYLAQLASMFSRQCCRAG